MATLISSLCPAMLQIDNYDFSLNFFVTVVLTVKLSVCGIGSDRNGSREMRKVITKNVNKIYSIVVSSFNSQTGTGLNSKALTLEAWIGNRLLFGGFRIAANWTTVELVYYCWFWLFRAKMMSTVMSFVDFGLISSRSKDIFS